MGSQPKAFSGEANFSTLPVEAIAFCFFSFLATFGFLPAAVASGDTFRLDPVGEKKSGMVITKLPLGA